jgi:hypothetical protein
MGLSLSSLGNISLGSYTPPKPAPPQPRTDFTGELFNNAKDQGSFYQPPEEFAPQPRETVQTPISWPRYTPPAYSPPSYSPPSYSPPSYSPPSYTPPWSFTPLNPDVPHYNPQRPPAPSPRIPVYNPPSPGPQAPPHSAPQAPPQAAPQQPVQQPPDLNQLSQQMALMVAPQQSVVIGGGQGQQLPFQADRSFRGKDPGIAQQHSKNYLDMIRAGFAGGG